MYIIKTKGTGNIPDFVQLRDKDFVLVRHFKISGIEEALKNLDINDKIEKIKKKISEIEYGQVFELQESEL